MATQVRTSEGVFEKIREVLVEEGFPEEKITMEASFGEDLGLDSLDRAELVLELEDQFEIRILDEDAERLTTVGEAVNYILKRQEGG